MTVSVLAALVGLWGVAHAIPTSRVVAGSGRIGAPTSIEHTGRVLHEVVDTGAKVTKGEEPVVTIPG